jgi:phage-related protein
MLSCRVVFYRDDDGTAPVIEWLRVMERRARGVAAKFADRVDRLSNWGPALRRPLVGYLGDGIYELRVRHRTVNYRVLFFFHGQHAVVLAHGLTKMSRVPPEEIERAKERRQRFELDPDAHTYDPER